MTANQISSIKENEIISIKSKVGLLGSSIQFQVFKNIDRFTDKLTYIVITREGFLKFFGNAILASFEGNEGTHKRTFKTAYDASKFINS